MNGAVVVRLAHPGFVFELFAARAIPSGVLAAIDGRAAVRGVRLGQPRPQFQHPGLVSLLGGANELVILDSEPFPQAAKLRAQLVAVLFRRDTALARDALNVLAMLVIAGEQKRVIALHSFEAPDGVGHQRRVGVAQVRRRVHVIERRGQIVLGLLGHSLPCLPVVFRIPNRAPRSCADAANPIS